LVAGGVRRKEKILLLESYGMAGPFGGPPFRGLDIYFLNCAGGM